MAKVVIKRLNRSRSKGSVPSAVAKKRVANGEGRSKVFFALDANSPTFDEGLHYVFRKNVAKARRENRRIVGSADIAPRKG